MRLINKQKLSEDTYLLKFAKNANCEPRPGQFIALEFKEGGERTPFLIADHDRNSLSIVISARTPDGKALLKLKKNADLRMFGPLGKPLKLKEYGNVCLVCEGTGLGAFYPIAKALKKLNNRIIVIAGFASRKQKFWEKKLGQAVDKFVTVIDKKTNITHGVVTEIHDLIRRKHFGFVLANCDPVVMREIARITHQRAKTYVILAPKIKDGVGMCGACRITYKEDVRFACIDGPAFNAHKLDWNEVLNKQRIWNCCSCKD